MHRSVQVERYFQSRRLNSVGAQLLAQGPLGVRGEPPVRPAAHAPVWCSVSVICAAPARPGRAHRQPRCLPTSRGINVLFIAHSDYNSAAGRGGAGRQQRACQSLMERKENEGTMCMCATRAGSSAQSNRRARENRCRSHSAQTLGPPTGQRAAQASNLLF